MRHRINKADRNQPDIDAVAREIGAHVIDMTGDGRIGFDRLYIFQGKTYIVEIKDEEQPLHKRVLTKTETEQMMEVEKRGVTYHIIENTSELLRMFGIFQ